MEKLYGKGDLYMKARGVTIALASIMILALAAAAYAGPGWGWGGRHGMGPVWKDLTPEQQTKAKELRLQFLKKIEPLVTELRHNRIEMMELASKPKPDDQAVEKKREEIWALQDKIRNEHRAMGKEFRALLTPEQKQKLGERGFGGGWGFGPGRGCGMGHGPGTGGGMHGWRSEATGPKGNI
jgi:Spy/CpxP family protein refolding chaperone